MKALQQDGTEPRGQAYHCCFVVYRFCTLLLTGGLTLLVLAPDSVRSDDLEEHAQIYINEFHEPDESLLLSKEGKNRGEALAHYSKGRSLENKGQTEAAIASYLKVLELHKGSHILARKTAHLMARNGKQEGGLKLLERNLEENPDKAPAHIALSEYLATYYSGDKAQLEKATAIIEAALKQFPDDPAVYERIVQLYLVSNRRNDAKGVIDNARKRNNSDPKFWLRLGILAGRVFPIQPDVKNNEPVVLNSIFKKALDFADDNLPVREKVGDFYRTTKQFDLAEAVYKSIIKDHTDYLEIRNKLAATYAAMQKEKELLETLKGIVEIDPLNAESHRRIAAIYMRRDDYPSAVKHLQAVLRIKKEGESAHLAVAELMVRTKEGEEPDPKALAEAVKFLERAAYLFPESPFIPNYAARLLRATERWKEAVIKTEIALKLAKKNKPEILDESFYFGFAAAVERSGDIPRAEKLFKKTIELINKNQPDEDPDKRYQRFVAQTYNYLGYMWLENDMNIDEAGEMIKTAVDLDPDSGAIADSIGWFHFKKGHYEDAKKELLRAEEMTEEPDGVIYDHLGQAHFHNGDKAEAIKYMQKAVEMDPKKKEFADRLKKYQTDLKKTATKPVATKPKAAVKKAEPKTQ